MEDSARSSEDCERLGFLFGWFCLLFLFGFNQKQLAREKGQYSINVHHLGIYLCLLSSWPFQSLDSHITPLSFITDYEEELPPLG